MPLKGYYRNELERVDKASKRLREVMDGLSSAFFIGMMTLDGTLTYANRTALESIGLQLKDVLGKPFVETPWWAYSEDTRQKLCEAITLVAKGEPSRFDMSFESINGELITVDFSLYPVFDAKGQVSYLVPSGHDITERKAAERASQMLNACHEVLLKAENEAKLLQDICQLIIDVGGYSAAFVGYAQHDEIKTIRPMASALQNPTITLNAVYTWDDTKTNGQGINGQCIRTGQVVICEDVQQDTYASYWREIAQHKGFRGGISLPLKQHDHTFGALTIMSSNVFKASNHEVELLKNLAESVAYGVDSLRARQQNQRILSAVYQIADGVSLATGQAFFQRLVLTMTAALGAYVGIITRLQIGEPPYSRTITAVLDGKLIENFDIPMSGTPCQHLNQDTQEWIVTSDVIQKYPLAEGLKTFNAQAYIGRLIENSKGEAIGQIFVLFKEPLHDTSYVSATLKIFTARVAAELERQHSA
jgi:PAS domain S-box-containing protein